MRKHRSRYDDDYEGDEDERDDRSYSDLEADYGDILQDQIRDGEITDDQARAKSSGFRKALRRKGWRG